MKEEPITVELTSDEALVLFEWLHRSEDVGHVLTPSAGQQIALWALSSVLESALVDPLAENYDDLVRDAESRLTRR